MCTNILCMYICVCMYIYNMYVYIYIHTFTIHICIFKFIRVYVLYGVSLLQFFSFTYDNAWIDSQIVRRFTALIGALTNVSPNRHPTRAAATMSRCRWGLSSPATCMAWMAGRSANVRSWGTIPTWCVQFTCKVGVEKLDLRSGKLTCCYGKTPCLMGKLTINWHVQ